MTRVPSRTRLVWGCDMWLLGTLEHTWKSGLSQHLQAHCLCEGGRLRGSLHTQGEECASPSRGSPAQGHSGC